jgi:hypothetical protein
MTAAHARALYEAGIVSGEVLALSEEGEVAAALGAALKRHHNRDKAARWGALVVRRAAPCAVPVPACLGSWAVWCSITVRAHAVCTLSTTQASCAHSHPIRAVCAGCVCVVRPSTQCRAACGQHQMGMVCALHPHCCAVWAVLRSKIPGCHACPAVVLRVQSIRCARPAHSHM